MVEVLPDEQLPDANKHIVILVHGIRDFALWQETVGRSLSEGWLPGGIHQLRPLRPPSLPGSSAILSQKSDRVGLEADTHCKADKWRRRHFNYSAQFRYICRISHPSGKLRAKVSKNYILRKCCEVWISIRAILSAF